MLPVGLRRALFRPPNFIISREVKTLKIAVVVLAMAVLFLGVFVFVRPAAAMTEIYSSLPGTGNETEGGFSTMYDPDGGDPIVDDSNEIYTFKFPIGSGTGCLSYGVKVYGNSTSKDSTGAEIIGDYFYAEFATSAGVIEVRDIEQVDITCSGGDWYHPQTSSPSGWLGYHGGWGDDKKMPFAVLVEGGEMPTPTVSVFEPAASSVIPVNEINAIGAGRYYFLINTDIDPGDWPDENPMYQVEVREYEGDTVLELTKSADDTYSGLYYYGPLTLDDNSGDLFAGFTKQDYEIRARVDFGDGFTDWTAWQGFTVGDYTEALIDPACVGIVDILTPCWWSNLAVTIFKPSDASISDLYAVIDEYKTRWPISWVVAAQDGFSAAFDQEQQVPDEPDEVNPLQGEFDADVIIYNLRRFYGETAGPACILFIWLMVLISIVKSVMTLLNIPYDPDIPAPATDGEDGIDLDDISAAEYTRPHGGAYLRQFDDD